MVCTMFATPTIGALSRGRRDAKMPSGTPMAIAASVDALTSSTCCASRPANSAPCDAQKPKHDPSHASNNCRIRGSGAARDRLRRVVRDQPSAVEHADARRQRKRFAHVVRHDDDGFSDARLNAGELARAVQRA